MSRTNDTHTSMALLDALSAASTALQKSAHSQDQVLRVFCEQVGALGLRGGLSLLDETSTDLIVQVVAQPKPLMRAIARLQKMIGLDARGYRFPVERVDAYRQAITTRQAVWLPNASHVAAQILPDSARRFAPLIAKLFGAQPGIFAPLIFEDRAQGVLNVVGPNLTTDDLAPMQVFANHLAIALENARLFASLHASEERFRTLIEQGSDILLILTPEGIVRYATPSVQRILGYTPVESVGKPIFEFAHPDNASDITNAIRHRVGHPGAADTPMQVRVRAHDGSWHAWEAIGNNQLANPSIGGIILTCRDITDHTYAEQALRRHDAILQAVGFAAEQFLKETAWEQNIQTVLSQLGRATGVSRVCIFENHVETDGTLRGSERYEWVAPGIAPQIGEPFTQNFSWTSGGMARWAAQMAQGAVICGNVRDFPEAERKLLALKGVQSTVSVPIFSGGNWWGFIGLDECTCERDWSQAEQDALRTAANIIGAALHRQHAQDALHARERHITLLNEITRAAISAQDFKALLQTLADRAGEALQADGCFITLWDEARQLTLPSAAYGSLKEIYPLTRVEPGEVTLTAAALKIGHALVAEDVFTSPYISPRLAKLFPSRSMLGLPLIAGGQRLGAAIIAFDQPHHFAPEEIARGEQIATQIALAVAQGRLLQAERARAAELEAVRQATITLTSTLDLHAVLDSILENAFNFASNAKDANIFLFQDNRLTFGAAREENRPASKPFAEPRQNGLTYQVARQGKPIIIPDMRGHPLFANMPPEWNGAIIGLPLKIGARVVGVMNIAYGIPREFSDEEVRVLQLLGDQAAIAIENARLFEAEKRRAAELEAVRQASITLTSSLDLQTVLNSILDKALQLVHPANDMHIFLYDDDRLSFGAALTVDGRKAPLWSEPRQNGVTYTVARTGKPIIIPDTRVHPLYAGTPADWGGSIISLPLIIGTRVVGVMNVAYWQPREFMDAEVRVLRLLGDQAAIAIENARLFNAEHALRERTEILRQAAQVVSSSLKLDEILRLILAQLKRVIAFDTASVMLYNAQGAPELVAGEGYADERVSNLAAQHDLKPSPILKRMARDHQAVIFPDVREQPEWIWVPGAEHVRSFLGVPILVQEQMIGVLMMDSKQVGFYTEKDAQLAQTLAQHLAIAIQNARLFEQTQARAREFAALYETARDLAGQSAVPELLKTILERATTLLDAPNGVIYLYDAARTELVNAASRGLVMEMGRRKSILVGASGIVAQTREPILINDYQTWEHRRPEYAGEPIRAVAQVPILYGGELVGVLGVAETKNQARRFTEEDVRLLSLFASQAASAVHNARLLSETKQRADQLAALFDITRDLASQHDASTLLHTIVERAIQLIGASNGAIYLYNSARGDLEITWSNDPIVPLGTRLQMGEGLAGRVAATRQPYCLNDYATWEGRSPQFEGTPYAAVVQAPMLFGGELIGVLSAHERAPSTRTFTQADMDLLSLFAGHAASALQNARLVNEANVRAQQLTLVYDAGLTLNRVLDPRVQLEFLFKTAMQALRAEKAAFFRYDAERNVLTYELGIGYTFAERELLEKLSEHAVEGEGLLGWVLQKRLPLYVSNVTKDPRYIAVNTRIRSGLWLPVEHEDELRGIIGILSTRVDAFSAQDQRLLALFANQAAVAMENARLFAETHQRLTELETVNRISVALRAADTIDEMLPLLLGETAAVLDSPSVTVWLYDSEKNELRQTARRDFPDIHIALKPGEGIAGRVLTTGEPYISRNFRTDPLTDEHARQMIPDGLAGACVPIRTGQDFAGVLFASVQHPREIRENHIRLLTTVAEIAGNAIHRMRLHEQTQHRASQLAAVNALGHVLSETRHLPEIYRRITRAMFELLPDIAAVLIALFDAEHQVITCAYGVSDGEPIDPHTLPSIPLEPPGFGAQSEAIHTRRPVIVGDLRERYEHTQSVVAIGSPQPQSALFVPMLSKGHVIGVIQAQSYTTNRFTPADAEMIDLVANAAASEIENVRLFANLADAYDETIEGWAQALDLRDKETQGHTRRVVEQTVQLARAMGIPEEEIPHVRRGALLHDIGKMGIPDAILLKPGPLNDKEWETMRLHPSYAYKLLAPIAYLRDALDIPYYHHEKWDGTGYPRGLKGEAIPLVARIFALVDVWDALCSDRPYRAAWPQERAQQYIREQAGIHFDPQVVEVFLRLENVKD